MPRAQDTWRRNTIMNVLSLFLLVTNIKRTHHLKFSDISR